jgi:hypothetical protein
MEMKHFPEQVWTDFVRRVPPQTVRTEHTKNACSFRDIESHLASGCKECTSTLAIWKQVWDIAAGETSYGPPESTVRRVKLEFAVRQLRDQAETADAHVVFDTFSGAMAFGIRSATAAPRQMVYEADGHTVDLRFDRQPNSNRVQLTGQVLGSERFGTVLGRVPVMVCTDRGILLAESTTNALGEFQLQFEAQDQLKLSIWVTSKKLIRIALVELQAKTEGDRTRGPA